MLVVGLLYELFTIGTAKVFTILIKKDYIEGVS